MDQCCKPWEAVLAFVVPFHAARYPIHSETFSKVCLAQNETGRRLFEVVFSLEGISFLAVL